MNSALHRARVTLAKNYHKDEHDIVQESRADAATSALLERYVRAWETDDVAGLVALLKEDATLSMPPFPLWYGGRESIRAILTSVVFRSGTQNQWHLYPTDANGQPAFALYRTGVSGDSYQAFGLQVVTLDYTTPTRQITDVTTFTIPSLVTYFGFPLQMP